MYGISLLHQGRFDEAKSHLTRALETDPLLAEASSTMGRVCLGAHESERAVAHLRKAVTLAPGDAIGAAASVVPTSNWADGKRRWRSFIGR